MSNLAAHYKTKRGGSAVAQFPPIRLQAFLNTRCKAKEETTVYDAAGPCGWVWLHPDGFWTWTMANEYAPEPLEVNP